MSDDKIYGTIRNEPEKILMSKAHYEMMLKLTGDRFINNVAVVDKIELKSNKPTWCEKEQRFKVETRKLPLERNI